MAIEVMTWVWNHSQSRHGARLVLLAIADAMSSGHAWAWPSTAELARKTALKERAVQSAVAELAKTGELEVAYNSGPKGCNRYRVLMSTTPADSAPPQNLHPADSAPPQNLRGQESAQASGQDPADSAPPADFAGVQISTSTPAESAPGTVREPKTKNSPTESSYAQNSLLSGDESSANGMRKRGRRPKPGPDPLFDEWYAAYPVHKSRGDAESAWSAAIREGTDPRILIAAAKRYRNDPQVLRGYGKYPATWLNKKCWLDEDSPDPDRQPPSSNPGRTAGRQVNYTDEEYTSGW